MMIHIVEHRAALKGFLSGGSHGLFAMGAMTFFQGASLPWSMTPMELFTPSRYGSHGIFPC